jgi:YcxB-like protein
MTGHFEQTAEDIDDAFKAHTTWAHLPGPALTSAALVWFGAIGLSAVVVWIGANERFKPGYRWPVSPFALLMASLTIPAFVLTFALQWLLGERATSKHRHSGIREYGAAAADVRHREGGAPQGTLSRGLIGWVLFISLAVLIFLAMQRSKRTPLALPNRGPLPPIVATDPDLDSRTLETGAVALIVIVPGIAAPIGLLCVLQRVNRLQKRERNRSLVGPTTLHASERGICFVTQRHRVYQRWSAFEKFLEGERLFLLYENNSVFRMVPKRAFASPEDLQRFVALLLEHVPNVLIARPAGGFPVQPPKR